MSRDPSHLPPDDAALPPSLLADLSALYPAPRVPAAVDGRVVNDAAATFARQARHRRWLRWSGAGAAAAAAVLVVGLILYRPGGPTGGTYTQIAPPRSPASPGDVDGDGRVDILDAFGLARKLRDAHGRPLPVTPAEDMNGDGVIDERDVDLIAHRAVSASDRPIADATGRPIQ